MSLFGEFHIPSDAFAFHHAFQKESGIKIEIERVVATDELLTPYFWVSNVSPEVFETAVQDDPTIEQLQRLDTGEETALYRADWKDSANTLVYAYTHIGATILDAEGENSEWTLRMRFDDREKLNEFNEYLNEEDVSFDLRQLYQSTHPRSDSQYGLTPKQTEALTTAWEMGYFRLPREITMEDVSDELDIAPQSLSDRLRRAQNTLIEETLRSDSPSDHDFRGVADG